MATVCTRFTAAMLVGTAASALAAAQPTSAGSLAAASCRAARAYVSGEITTTAFQARLDGLQTRRRAADVPRAAVQRAIDARCSETADRLIERIILDGIEHAHPAR